MEKRTDHKVVILLAHGSPKKHAKEVLLKIKKKISKYFKNKCFLKHAFLQFNNPSLAQCLNEIDPKIKYVVILPVFISHGKHTLQDIPTIINSYKNNRKHNTLNKLNVKIAEPLGADDLLVKALLNRYSKVIGKD